MRGKHEIVVGKFRIDRSGRMNREIHYAAAQRDECASGCTRADRLKDFARSKDQLRPLIDRNRFSR